MTVGVPFFGTTQVSSDTAVVILSEAKDLEEENAKCKVQYAKLV